MYKIYKNYSEIKNESIEKDCNICYLRIVDCVLPNSHVDKWISIPESSSRKDRDSAIAKLNITSLGGAYIGDLYKGEWIRELNITNQYYNI